MGSTVAVRVTPRASRRKLACHDGKLVVSVCAAPVGSAANKEATEMLAEALGVPKSSITIKRGASSREKVIEFATLESAELASRLSKLPGN